MRRVTVPPSKLNFMALLSKLSNEYIKFMLGLKSTDTTTAYKCFRKEVLQSINLDRCKGKQNAFLMEIVFFAEKQGFKVCEIPFMFIEREAGESKMKFSVAIESLLMVFKLLLYKMMRKT